MRKLLSDTELIAKYYRNMELGERCNDGELPASFGTSLWEEEMELVQEFKRRGIAVPKWPIPKKGHKEQTDRALRFKILSRDKFTCQYCGRKAPEVLLEVDHIIPKSKGGTKHPSNLITSCFDCNRGKRDRVIEGGAK